MSMLRVIHNVYDGPSVDVYANGKPLICNVSYGDITKYLNVPSSVYNLEICAHQENEPFLSGEVIDKKILLAGKLNVRRERIYTLVVSGQASTPESLRINCLYDCLKCPKLGYAHIRVIHAAAGIAPVDVYAGDQKLLSNVAYPDNSGYLEIDLNKIPKVVPVTVRISNSRDIAIGPIQLYLMSGGIYTIVATGLDDDLSLNVTLDNKGFCEKLQQKFCPQKYAGKWFQLAHIPQRYDADCANATAEYTLLNDYMKVHNVCYNSTGNAVRVSEGIAYPIDNNRPAALKVSFNDERFEEEDISEANYLVHKTDYNNYSIVGSPDRKSLYVLIRPCKCFSKKHFEKIIEDVKCLGYDLSKIVVNRDLLK